MTHIIEPVSNKPNSHVAKAVSLNWTHARIIDELFNFLRSYDKQIDAKGHKRSRYESKAEFILPRMNVYKPSPTFILYESDLPEQLKDELSPLDSESLDDVMRESIYDLLDELQPIELKTFVRRRDIRWEIQK